MSTCWAKLHTRIVLPPAPYDNRVTTFGRHQSPSPACSGAPPAAEPQGWLPPAASSLSKHRTSDTGCCPKG
eukprot:scaffold23552_cov133-Isochrysis_galbana.AAC.1